jgi:hypothetical protein
MKLLTRANAKIVKGERRGFVTFILHLAPAKLSGYEVCGGSSPECRRLCLNISGRGKFDATQQARIKKTKWFFEDRNSFMAQLVKDISAAIRYGMRNNLVVCIRLNGTSDIPWESIRCGNFENIMERYPFVQFYDYTKLLGRTMPSNYHLTFSLSETNQDKAKIAMAQGMNIAVVFDHIPLMWQGMPVISGDEDDLRFLDPQNHVIGLQAKGAAVNSQSIFIQRTTYGKPASSFVPRITGRGHRESSQGRSAGVSRQRQARRTSHSLSR